MTHPRWIRILALLLLVTALPCVSQAGAFYCEGRQCGIMPWQCCCDAPATGQADRCALPTERRTEIADCSDECGCVVVITSCEHQTTLAKTASPAFPAVVALAPAPPAVYIAPATTEPVAYPTTLRGPPCRRAPATPSGLRAPPAA